MGRKAAKNRERHADGQLKRSSAIPPTQVRRIIDLARTRAVDPRLGTEIGRLRLNDVLTDRQFAAADWFAGVVARYDRLRGLPRRAPKSPSYEMSFASFEADPHDLEILADLERTGGDLKAVAGRSPRAAAVVEVVKRFKAADEALHAISRAARTIAYAAIIENICVLAVDYEPLRRALDNLAVVQGGGRIGVVAPSLAAARARRVRSAA